MLLPDGRQISTSTLFGAFFGHRHALSEGSRHFARCHRVGAAARMVVNAIDRARKLDGSLPQQRSNAHVGMSPINQR
ncbi:hypothetical protein ACSFA7_05465 [Variovorax sp. LT1R20]|uniref:hypothetical protein n=1 Tax=Variovorax sp. LT1R20 TaxID=3443729 RepID=UPI003F457829